MQKMDSVTGFKLDPTSYARTIHQFDVTQGRVDYHRRCRGQFQRAPIDQTHSIRNHHMATFSLLDSATCAAYRAVIDQDSNRVLEQGFIAELLSQVFTDETDSALTAYFGSEYHADWYSLQMSDPGAPGNYSNDWHFDVGSTRQLKILCFLNDVEEHQAPTLYLPIDQSKLFARLGYGYPAVEDRLNDLSPLAQAHGLSYTPEAVPLKAGEALMFNPQVLLHRGQVPLNSRYLIQIAVIPSSVHWKQTLASGRHWPRFEPGAQGWPIKRGGPTPTKSSIASGRVEL
ncbi:hypothetical protein [Magnetospira sp. QH-2]|uniref:hypothetical protein n=1 Tax=Magnetospira sp. (strain QH-2) TaxID=1288970 RepID=UPI00130D60E3|nr:hypothetical protein [Magnetospira sp. QH-2]